MVNVFDQCNDSCGWVAAFVAAIAYGSFGVPVKATKHIDVHPLILQSYKTFVVFITCWFVALLGVPVGFTKWGLLSGFLWVVGGTGGTSSILYVFPTTTICSNLQSFHRNLRHPNGWIGDRSRNMGLHNDHGQFHLWNCYLQRTCP